MEISEETKNLMEKTTEIDTNKNNNISWSAYAKLDGSDIPIFLKPLSWKGGDQLSDLLEIMRFFRENNVSDRIRILIYKSICGSGKSLTLLHVPKEMDGKAIVVTPFKNLQRQYLDDYYKGNKYVLKKDGSKLKVAVMLGRGNFQCKWLAEQYDLQLKLIEESKKPENASILIPIDDHILQIYRFDSSCANHQLPCTRQLRAVSGRRREPRWMAASTCPFWIPTPLSKTMIDKLDKKISEDIDEEYCEDDSYEGENIREIEKNIPNMNQKAKTRLDIIKEKIKCSRVEYYEAVGWGPTGVFIRDEKNKDGNKCPEVCPYYQQFYAYVQSDVIVMNSAKWHLETRIGRKPKVSVEIFDEGDYWLDNQASEIEFARSTIDKIYPIDNQMKKMKSNALAHFDMAFDNIKKRIEQSKTKDFGIIDTKEYQELFLSITNCLLEYKRALEDDDNIEQKILDMNNILRYINKASMSYKEGKREETMILKIFIPYPDNILKELFNASSKNIIITSGTMHSNSVLSNLFGINNDNYLIYMLEGRKESPGKLRCIRPKADVMSPIKVTHTSWQSHQFVEYYNKYINYILDNLKIVIDKATGKPGEAKIIVLTPAKKYAEGILKRPDVFVDFAKSKEEDDSIKMAINTNLSDYVNNTLEDIRKTRPTDIQLDGDVLRTDKQIIVSTRMIRGADLRDDLCRGVVMTKWPLGDISAGYNQALKKRFGDNIFWSIVKDKATREAVQYVSRGLRHERDWCYFSTPDDFAFNNIFRLFSYEQ